MTPRRRLLRALGLGLLLAPVAAAADEAAWRALAQPGAIVLFRHADAPGIGDPPGMRLDDCATQRNLGEAGRAQARRLGEALRARGVRVGAVMTSQWCRARDTARLAFEAQALVPREEPAFNSFFAGQGDPVRQGAAARELLRRWQGPGVLVVVTHQVNITGLTDVTVASGEGVVVAPPRPGAGQAPLKVLGRLPPP